MLESTKEVILLSEEVPVVGVADVIVVGGGPAGIAAAVASARAGATTILIERYGCLGGNAGLGLVGPFMTCYDATGKRQIVAGIFEELVKAMEAERAAIHPSQVRARTSYCSYISYGHDHVTPFEPQSLVVAATRLVMSAGVKLLLHSMSVRPVVQDNRVTGVIAAGKSGFQAILGKVVVDCTGDADVAFAAGAPIQKGRNSDGLMQPATLFFRITNVDEQKVDEYMRENPHDAEFVSLVARARAEGKYSINHDMVSVYKSADPSVWRVNATRIQGVDGTNVFDLTRAEIEGRQQVNEVLTFLKTYVPGFEDARLVDVAAYVGVRETRHIVGEYVLTDDDIVQGREFPDSIALYAYPMDIHDPSSSSTVLRGLLTRDFYQIPYRSLLPLEVEGLLVAGRPISATHEAAGAIRCMPCCMATGQAAGVAAALSARCSLCPRDVDVAEIQKILVDQGATIR